jgi:hypothetical protein
LVSGDSEPGISQGLLLNELLPILPGGLIVGLYFETTLSLQSFDFLGSEEYGAADQLVVCVEDFANVVSDSWFTSVVRVRAF